MTIYMSRTWTFLGTQVVQQRAFNPPLPWALNRGPEDNASPPRDAKPCHSFALVSLGDWACERVERSCLQGDGRVAPAHGESKRGGLSVRSYIQGNLKQIIRTSTARTHSRAILRTWAHRYAECEIRG